MLKRFILFLLLIPTLAWADSQPQFDILTDFSKGENSHISPYLTPTNEAVSAQNIRINSTYGGIAKRPVLSSYLSYGSAPINGLYRYYNNTTASQYNVVAITTYLMTDVSGSTVTLKSALTTEKRWQFITFNNVVIGGNGADNCIKWDGVTQTTADTVGSRSANCLVADLGAPFATLATGSGLTASKWYKYKVGYYDGYYYYYSNSMSNTIKMGATTCKQVTLSNIPLGQNTTTHRYIFRTNGDTTQAGAESDTTYYMIHDIADNSTVSWVDSIADSGGSNSPTWATVSAGINVTPPLATMFEINSSRIFSAGNPTYQSWIYFCDTTHPDFWLPSSYLSTRKDDGDVVTFVKNNLGVLTIGKTNTIQKAYTQGATSTWVVSDPFSNIGCPAPLSAQNTPMGIIYLGRNGLYLFSGTSSQLISDSITEEIQDILSSNLANVVGVYYNNEYRLAYTSAKSGSTINNKTFLYSFTRDAYVLDTENVNCFCYFNSGTDLGVLYSGSSASDGYVVAHSPSYGSLVSNSQAGLDAGTYTDTSSVLSADNNNPVLSNGWSCTIAGWLTDLQAKNASINTIADIITYLPNATIQTPNGSGTWVSPVYRINAAKLDKLYWNQSLGLYGGVSFQVRTGAVATPDGSWTAYSTVTTNPNGADISGTAGNFYIQVKITLTTSNTQYPPKVFKANGYLFQIGYYPVGSNYETSYLTIWQTGWINFTKGSQYEGNMKMINRIKVFYTGTAGLLSFNILNDDGSCNQTFTIDLSLTGQSDTTGQVTNNGASKVFTYYPPMNSVANPTPVGQYFMYTITENGVVPWTINKVETQFSIQELRSKG